MSIGQFQSETHIFNVRVYAENIRTAKCTVLKRLEIFELALVKVGSQS